MGNEQLKPFRTPIEMTIEDAAIAIIVSVILEFLSLAAALVVVCLLRRLKNSGLCQLASSEHQRLENIPPEYLEGKGYRTTGIITGAIFAALFQVGALMSGLVSFILLK